MAVWWQGESCWKGGIFYWTNHSWKLDKLVIDEINTQGVLWKKIKYSYDNKGNRVEVNVYDAQKKEAPKYAGGAQQPKKEQPKQPFLWWATQS